MAKIIPVATFDCVVFGATGDLTLRKLLPALYYRFRDGQMPPESRVIAAARSDWTTTTTASAPPRHCRSTSPSEDLDPDVADRFCARLQLSCGWTRPSRRTRLERRWRTLLDPDRVRVFYLATSPDLYGPICRNIGAHGLVTEQSRVVLEKPIGHDLASARADQRRGRRGVHRAADLPHRPLPGQGDGAEPAGAALRQHDLRAAVERRRDRPRADHRGRDGRAWSSAAATTTSAGALRDMVQNHMLQLLCLIAMEPPVSLDADRVRDEKLKVLRALRPIEPHEVPTLTVRGQYTQGAIDGKPVPGYIADLDGAGDQRHRDLRRAEGGGAHLALGERAVLPAHRQAPAAEGVGDRHPVSARCRSRSFRPTRRNGRRTS